MTLKEYPIEEELEEAYTTINQLTNNWNELEKYINSLWLDDKGIILKIKDKMKEILNMVGEDNGRNG